MNRICPDCQATLEPRTLHGITIDACAKCAGIFFDHGEVGQLKNKGLDVMDEIEDAVMPTITVEHSSDRARICPCCTTGMDKFRYLYNSKIVLDECDKCGGIWVQDGELKRMSEFLASQAPRAAATDKKEVKVETLTATPVAASFRGRIRRVQQFLQSIGSA